MEANPMLFLDCEFTDLLSPRLLSLALVSDHGPEIYLELTDPIHHVGASSFTRETVLPMFGILPISIGSMEAFGRRLGEWLIDLDRHSIDVAFDFGTDFVLLQRVLCEADFLRPLATKLRPINIRHLLDVYGARDAMERSWASSLALQGIRRHHALADARALAAAFAAVCPAR